MPSIALTAPTTDALVQSPRDGGRTIGRVEAHDDPARAEAGWRYLEERCPGSVYQTRRFLLPWLEAFAAPLGITPMLVLAHDCADNPVAFLPFGVRREGFCQVAEFLGGKDSNANMGLFAPDVRFGRDELASMLRAAAAKSRRRPDIFRLLNQPDSWEGLGNPLGVFPSQPSASFLHGGALDPDPAVFAKAHLSKDTAKKLRAKRRKLEVMGKVAHVMASDSETSRRLQNAFFEQKLARFREKNIDSVFETAEARRFLDIASNPREEGSAAVEWHALTLDDRVIATYAGGVHRGRLHLMVNSFDLDAEIARSSPGDLLLQMILEQKCRDGLTSFDLGIGEARYKDSWCDQSIQMHDSIVPMTRRGHVYARVESARLNAKRWIKRSDWALPLARRLMGRK